MLLTYCYIKNEIKQGMTVEKQRFKEKKIARYFISSINISNKRYGRRI
jgi:hypothetical protein